MKLNRHIKSFISSSIYETGIIELKFMVENYGTADINRALKIIDYLRVRRNLILKKMYANCTKVYPNYYKYSAATLAIMGYCKEEEFYTFRDFSVFV